MEIQRTTGKHGITLARVSCTEQTVKPKKAAQTAQEPQTHRPVDNLYSPVDYLGRPLGRQFGAKLGLPHAKPKREAPPTPKPELKRDDRDIIDIDPEPAIPEPTPEPCTRDWMVIQTMHDMFKGRPPEIVPDRSGEILHIVCAVSGLSKMELIGANRCQKFVKWRHVAAYFLRVHRGLSLPTVGRILGGRDHSTIHHAVTKIENNMMDYRLMLNAVEAYL